MIKTKDNTKRFQIIPARLMLKFSDRRKSAPINTRSRADLNVTRMAAFGKH